MRRSRRRLWQPGLLGALACLRDFGLNLRVDGVHVRISRNIRFQQLSAKALDGATFAPRPDFLPRAISVVAHAFRVRPGAVGFAFEQRGTAAGAGAFHRFASRFRHGDHIVTVHLDAGNAVASATTRDAGVARRILKRNFGRKLVVLADE